MLVFFALWQRKQKQYKFSQLIGNVSLAVFGQIAGRTRSKRGGKWGGKGVAHRQPGRQARLVAKGRKHLWGCLMTLLDKQVDWSTAAYARLSLILSPSPSLPTSLALATHATHNSWNAAKSFAAASAASSTLYKSSNAGRGRQRRRGRGEGAQFVRQWRAAQVYMICIFVSAGCICSNHILQLELPPKHKQMSL